MRNAPPVLPPPSASASLTASNEGSYVIGYAQASLA
jgi:hypothetical protein